MNKALFLDRDGVVNVEKSYTHKIEDFEFIDGVFDVCRFFQEKGYLIIIITNQSGIARGMYTESDYNILTTWMIDKFSQNSINISSVYHCPHHPDYGSACLCRKPKPNLILEAIQEFNINSRESILVGDKNSDIEAGILAGIGINYLIMTGHKILKNEFNVIILKNLYSLLK